jgi:hypothetical protein
MKHFLLVCQLKDFLSVERTHFLNYNWIPFFVYTMETKRVVFLHFIQLWELESVEYCVHLIFLPPLKAISYHLFNFHNCELPGSAKAQQVVVVPLVERVKLVNQHPLPHLT